VSVRTAARATGREPPSPAAAARTVSRGGAAAAGAGIASRIEMDILAAQTMRWRL